MKLPRNRRQNRSGRNIEALESRCLLSATLLSQIPAQAVQAGQTSANVNLSTYFNDPTITGTAIEMQTPLGNIPLLLTDSATPQTVANFVNYIKAGEYSNTIVHRSVPGFVIQGGGYTPDGNHIQTFNYVLPGESSTATLQNTTGTIAMALSNGPGSANSEWFINLAVNSNLDNTVDGGPFTAFGNVIYNGMAIVNSIAALPIVNGDAQNAGLAQYSIWGSLPVRNYAGPNPSTGTLPTSDLVTNNTIVVPGGLTYAAQSSNPNLLTASISNGMLTLNGGANSGAASVTVTATDLGGGVATSVFSVNVTGGFHNPSLGTTPTTTTLAASATAIPSNGATTFTATVTPTTGTIAPTGTVTFLADGTPIGAAPLVGNAAVFSTHFAAPESAVVTAVFAPTVIDGVARAFDPSTSSPVTLNVTQSAITPVVSKSSVPASVIGGKPVHGFTIIQLTNSTATTEKGLATINLYAVLNGSLDASSTVLATLKRQVNLKPGKTLNLRLPIKSLPATLADGTYTLLTQTIDPSGATTDAASGPTVQIAAPFVNVTPSGAAITPATLKLGRGGTLTVTLTNTGNIDSSGVAAIALGLSTDGQTQAVSLTNFNRAIKVRANHSVVLHLHFPVGKTVAVGPTYRPFVSITQDGNTATSVGVDSVLLGA
ncbi:MAG TPA: peptidylprolyl isomerase [Tepidisphaeraceae bacterium]|nr:peptidylprolyl isomerase [Tepidisphaeraceae bacterium]